MSLRVKSLWFTPSLFPVPAGFICLLASSVDMLSFKWEASERLRKFSDIPTLFLIKLSIRVSKVFCK